MAPFKVSPERVAACGNDLKTPRAIGALQVAIYVACGGGHPGRFACRQPADFYIDTGVGRLPYSRNKIYQMVEVLAKLAIATGLDPHNMPEMPDFHGCGVF